MQSDTINELSAALAKAQGTMKAATFNRVNPHFKNRYADLAAVLEVLREPLAQNGLSITQTMDIRESGLVLLTTMRHSSGQWIDSEYPLPNASKPQELGSALTYARRYSLCAMTCIAADDDDDAEAARQQNQRAPAARKPAPPSANVMPTHDPNTGEIEAGTQASVKRPPTEVPASPSASPASGDAGDLTEVLMEHDKDLARAAENGTHALSAAWSLIPGGHQKTLKAALDRRHKPRAMQVDQAGAK